MMILQQKTYFHKGISSDADYSKRGNDVWDFPSLNIRILNKEGQGFIITNVDGNTDPTTVFGEDHRISTGFRIIGACEYNGIAYIFSFNETNSYGEMGCFPSPNTLDYDGTAGTYPSIIQFERQYRPLRNYTTAFPIYTINTVRNPMSTSIFDWDMEHQIDVFAREDYDNTVNLYFCDWKNPNRVINSGFDQLGNIMNRLYNDVDFFTNINQLLTTGNSLDLTLNKITGPGGSISYGNYIFYFGYLNLNLNSTPFIAESGPCQIFEGNINNLSTIEGGTSIALSDKKVYFTLDNLDQTYTYIQVAYTKYYGDASCVPLSETFLIDFKYPINGQTTIDITIDGTENVIPIDISEILRNIGSEDCCKSHDHSDNMYFGANWKGIDPNNDALTLFALKIQTHYDDSKSINGESYYGHEGDNVDPLTGGTNTPGQYKDYFKTHDNSGYFRTEAYPFGVIFKFNNGSYSYAFPVTSFDELDGLVGVISNSNGIHRFPRQYRSNVNNGTDLKVMGVKFDTSAAISWLQAPPPSELVLVNWIKKYVKSIYFVRSERIKNLLYQGFAMNVCSAKTDIADDFNTTMAYSYFWIWNQLQCPPYTLAGAAVYMNNAAWQTDDTKNYVGTIPSLGQIPGKYAGAAANNLYNSWWGSDISQDFNKYETGVTVMSITDCKFMPIYKAYVPMTYVIGNDDSCNYVSRFAMKKDHLAIYSPDYLFCLSADLSEAIQNGYIERQSKNGMRDILDHDWGLDDIFPHFLLSDMNDNYVYDDCLSAGYSFGQLLNASYLVDVGKTSAVTPSTAVMLGSLYFVNSCLDYWQDQANVLFEMHKGTGMAQLQIWSTRSMNAREYILYKWLGAYNQSDDMNHSIVNIYKEKPTLANMPGSSINLASLIYSKISGVDNSGNEVTGIDLFDAVMNPVMANYYIMYRGDCFLQRTYIHQMSWNCTGVDLNAQGPIGCNYYDAPGQPAFDTVDISGPDPCKQKRYTHGFILGIITENAINTAMRFSDGTDDYYPHVVDLFDIACKPILLRDESLMYNAGHHCVLSQKVFNGFDINLPAITNKFPTRIRHSNYHIPYSFIDGYRLLDPNSYKDYDLKYGQINSLRYVSDSLVSVQEHCTNQHYNNEKQLKTPTTSGDLILGMGPILDQNVKRLQLHGTQHQWSIAVTDNGMYGVDFMDKIIWQVRLATSTSGDTTSLNASQLTLNKEIEKWMYEISDIIDKRTDKVTKFDDHPVLYEGILTGFDRKYSEVLFTFHYRTNYHSIGSLIVNSGTTWVTGTYYSVATVLWVNGQLYMCTVSHVAGVVEQDDLDQYFQLLDLTNVHSYDSTETYNKFDIVCCCDDDAVHQTMNCNVYVIWKNQGPFEDCDDMMIGVSISNPRGINTVYGGCDIVEEYDDYSKTLVFNELIEAFTCEYSFAPPFYYNIYKDLFSERPNTSLIYKHNQETSPNTFYGTQYPVQISYIVNGYSQEQSTIDYVKTFLSKEIEINRFNLFQIDYTTQYQISTHNWITDAGKIWIEPQYLEHKWVLPVNVQTGPLTDVFNPGTNMRGKWLLTTITYQGTDRIELKNVSTNYIISKS